MPSLQYVKLIPPVGIFEYVCRGEDGCGTPLAAEDRSRHSAFHADVWGSLTEVVPGYSKREEPA
jgi:hypothetical protein